MSSHIDENSRRLTNPFQWSNAVVFEDTMITGSLLQRINTSLIALEILW